MSADGANMVKSLPEVVVSIIFSPFLVPSPALSPKEYLATTVDPDIAVGAKFPPLYTGVTKFAILAGLKLFHISRSDIRASPYHWWLLS